jgi:hypothetical protein
MRLSQAVLLVFFAAAAGQPSPTIEFHSPTPGQSVSGRSFTIEVEVAPSFHVPEQGKGILFLDGGKLLEVRQQRVTISMDGAGGLAEGPHKLRLELFALDGTTLAAQEVCAVRDVPSGSHGGLQCFCGSTWRSRFWAATIVPERAHTARFAGFISKGGGARGNRRPVSRRQVR